MNLSAKFQFIYVLRISAIERTDGEKKRCQFVVRFYLYKVEVIEISVGFTFL